MVTLKRMGIMKRTILFIFCLALLVAGCSKEQVIETMTGETPRHLTIDITVNPEGPDTRAVKTGWENGDKIYVFFDFGKNTTSDEHMTMTYDGSKWSYEFSNETMEAALLAKTGGKLGAVYFPYGTPAFSYGKDGSDIYVNFGLDPDVGTNYSYSWSSYTVSEGKLTATLDMSLSNVYVQFFIPGVTEASNLLLSCDKMKASIPESIRYFYDGPSGFNAFVADKSKDYGDLMKGFLYQDGIIFSGILEAYGSSADYSFTLTDTRGTESTADDIVYSLSFTGKTLQKKDAVKLPALSSSRWTKGINGHAFVEMGDGLKWATCNIGAENPQDYGDYFAWGETETKESYGWATYKWMQEGQSDWRYITKYTFADSQTEGIWYDSEGSFIGDGKTSLKDYDYADDAARGNWKSTWRMPTDAEWTVLRNTDNFDWTWTDDYEGTGVAGRIVTSKVAGYEGNSIFLPAAGSRYGSDLYSAGSYGYYRSSSLSEYYSDYARYVYFTSEGVYKYNHDRYYGQSVRPVSE